MVTFVGAVGWGDGMKRKAKRKEKGEYMWVCGCGNGGDIVVFGLNVSGKCQ